MTTNQKRRALANAARQIGAGQIFGHDPGIGFECRDDAEAFVKLAQLPFDVRIVQGQHWLHSPYSVCIS